MPYSQKWDTMYLNFFSELSIIPYLVYGCKVWGQNQNKVLVQRLQKLQEKAACLINFVNNPIVVDQVFKDNNILKLTNFIVWIPSFIKRGRDFSKMAVIGSMENFC